MSYITITIEEVVDSIVISPISNEDTVTITIQDAVYVVGGVGGGAVDSVNGQAGTVTLDTDNIGEGVINLYHTEDRVAATANVAANTTHRTATDNPHGVTKEQVGLSNVNNTSDLNKPVSTATQSALDAKISADGSVTTHSDVTDAGSGAIITGTERTKLNGIEAGATADQTGAEIITAIDTELGNTDWQGGGGGGGGWTRSFLSADVVATTAVETPPELIMEIPDAFLLSMAQIAGSVVE